MSEVLRSTFAPTARDCFCGENRARLHFRTARFGLVSCPSCGCYRIDPPPIQGEEEAGEFYSAYYEGLERDAAAAKSESPTAKHAARHAAEGAPGASAVIGANGVNAANGAAQRTSRYWRVVNEVPSLREPGESAADIGCGEGTLCAELRAAGWRRVIGVDASRARVARARRRHPDITFHDSPLEEVDIPAGSLDLIVLDNVIEHLVDPLDAVRRLRALLAAGGRLVLITPNMESGHFRLLGRRWTPELAPHTHIFLFTHAAMRRMLAAAGYVVETQGDFHLPLYTAREWVRRVAGGDVKGALWRAMQEAGGVYGRLVGAGPMLYAVARPAAAGAGAAR
ncbi:MAG TPA: class I SAM-dependent methyltransferase [Gemmatimonadaceae bacterium]|nr:class I SAM-dependent methyltransferase [Gemmatimonadaceae bacterium]